MLYEEILQGLSIFKEKMSNKGFLYKESKVPLIFNLISNPPRHDDSTTLTVAKYLYDDDVVACFSYHKIGVISNKLSIKINIGVNEFNIVDSKYMNLLLETL